jgi:hypothetical protein
VPVSGAIYLNAGDTVTITYTFNSSPATFMHGGDRIQLNNGGFGTFAGNTSTTATFTYVVTSGSTNSLSLGQTTTTIVPGDRLTPPQPGFTYPVSSYSPGTTVIVDTIAPAPPVITGISPDTDPVGDNATAATTITINGTAEANSTVTVFRDSAPLGTVTANSSGAWSYTDSNLQNLANYQYTARQSDVAGNQGGVSSPYAVHVDTAICFYPGTLIRTAGGATPVEALKIGDLVLASSEASVALKPVRWIGRQTISTLFADPATAYPIQITAGALGEGLPARDLCVSPDHALFLEGVLIQAGALVNGGSIRRLTRAELPEVFTYFHIELEGHDLVLAEGVLAESFVDNVTRRRFDNHAEYEALFGEERTVDELDLPRVKSVRQLPAAIRAYLTPALAA